MDAIVFVNEDCLIGSIQQKQSLYDFLRIKGLKTVKLNPCQLYIHYTNFHALLFDLRKHSKHVNMLLIYSNVCAEDFIKTYPARWLLIKSFFKEVVFLQDVYIPSIHDNLG
ncbi:hypothetical protein [Bacillus sp. EB01]|uniref:hypothetical protein n=1 Tax=Bacillus sp. EB01 TaxID=1347086 RepID=UPI0005C74971|nr:hypothetical protein [Bacillus sp. EB01]